MNSEQELTMWDESRAPGWFAQISLEEYQKLASLGYSPEQLAMYYDVRLDEFLFYFSLLHSPLKYYYDRGQLVQQAKEAIVMTDAAATGENVTQAQRLDKMRRAVEFKNHVNNVFFDDLDV